MTMVGDSANAFAETGNLSQVLYEHFSRTANQDLSDVITTSNPVDALAMLVMRWRSALLSAASQCARYGRELDAPCPIVARRTVSQIYRPALEELTSALIVAAQRKNLLDHVVPCVGALRSAMSDLCTAWDRSAIALAKSANSIGSIENQIDRIIKQLSLWRDMFQPDVVLPEVTDSERLLLNAIDATPRAAKELADVTGLASDDAVRHLIKKLRDKGHSIKTVRGAGYIRSSTSSQA